MIVCKLCKAVVSGETTVGDLINEGDVLRREGMHNHSKLFLAMKKYNAAWSALNKSGDSHAECVKSVDEDCKAVYRSLGGSRA